MTDSNEGGLLHVSNASLRAKVEGLLRLSGTTRCRRSSESSSSRSVALGLGSLGLVGLVERREVNSVKVIEVGQVLLRARLEELGLEVRA